MSDVTEQARQREARRIAKRGQQAAPNAVRPPRNQSDPPPPPKQKDDFALNAIRILEAQVATLEVQLVEARAELSEQETRTQRLTALADEMGDGVSPECSSFAEQIRAIVGPECVTCRICGAGMSAHLRESHIENHRASGWSESWKEQPGE